jgi:hypothetical protein
VKREIHVLVSFPGRLLGIYDYNTQMSCNLNKGEEVFRQGCTDFYSPGHSGQTPDVKSWRFAQNVVCMVVGNAARLPEFEYMLLALSAPLKMVRYTRQCQFILYIDRVFEDRT